MAAGQGFKTFVTGEVLTAGDVNGYLMQGINVFADATARDAAILTPAEGQFAFTKDNNSLWYYDGAAWVASGATGDIEGVTAGVGISGGGTSGTVTLTNSMATAIDAKGDLVPGTGADTFARLAVGANNTVLTADSAEATGLKWSAISGFATTLISTTSLSGAATTISGISGSSYSALYIICSNMKSTSGNSAMNITLNGVTSGYSGFISQYNASWSTAMRIGNLGSLESVLNMNIFNVKATTGNKFIQVSNADQASTAVIGAGILPLSAAITSITFTGTATLSGTVYLLGA